MSDDESKQDIVPVSGPPAGERASESRISFAGDELLLGRPPPAKPVPAISSTPLELAAIATPRSDPPPPSTRIEDLVRRPVGMPLAKVIAIGLAIFAGVVALTWLVLFR